MSILPRSKPSHKASRVLLWLAVLLLIANALVFYLRDRFGSVAAVLGSSALTATENDKASPRSAIPGIKLLPDQLEDAAAVKSTAAITSPAASAGQYTANALCWFITAGAAAQYSDGQEGETATGVDTRQKPVDAPRLPQLQKRLASLNIAAELVDVELVDAKQYMVIVSGIDQGDTVATLQWLLARNYDAFVVQLDPATKAVALDIFSNADDASEAAERFMRSGVEVEVLAHAESTVRPRLRLPEQEAGKLSRRLWSRLQADFPGLHKERKYCRSIAPPA